MTALTQARIGYAGYGGAWTAPGDRRRFVAYARQRGLTIEPADPGRDYDVVVVTYNGDLPGWIRRRKSHPEQRLVFELVDSYLTQRSTMHSLAKGLARFMLGTDSISHFYFNRTLIAACRTADAVICSTDEQRDVIRRYNANVHTSFDFFDAEIAARKLDYSVGPKLKLVWEGQANTLPNLLSLAGTLNAMADGIELHVVTDPVRFRHFGRFRPVRSSTLLDVLLCRVIFHPWERDTFAAHVVAADVAIIPIDLDDAFATGKPENKLIMLWKMGMPVIAAATPAYARAMASAGIDLAVQGPGEWRNRLELLAGMSAAERAAVAKRGQMFAAERYSQQSFADRFDTMFRSIGFTI